MKPATRQQLLGRLRRAEGQVAGIRRMVEEGEGCVEILLQIAAVRGALAKVAQVLLGSHLETCVSDAFASGDEGEARAQLGELVDLFGRYGGIAAR